MTPGSQPDASAIAVWTRELLNGETGGGIARWMSEQRWFGDKSRPVDGLLVRDLLVVAWGEVWLLWPSLDVRFADGGAPHPYTLPLALVPEAEAGENVAPLAVWPDAALALVDAVRTDAFASWLLDQLGHGASLPAKSGSLVFAPTPEFPSRSARASAAPVRAGGLEQSNTLIRYGDVLVIKLFRRLQPGINVDAEMGRFLYETAGFRSIPAPLGEILWTDQRGESVAVGFAQAFAPNLGDGWSWTLSELAQTLATANERLHDHPTVAAFGVLGQRTAEMHRALAVLPDDANFALEPVTAPQADAMAESLTAFLAATAALMREQRDRLPAPSLALVDRFLAAVPNLRARAADFERGAAARRIRVHGDYHLGQTLRTPDGDWMLIDFEGEPARPLFERRTKYPALRDVAGMTRSIGYARAVAARNAAIDSESTAGVALARWETAARTAFLRGYREHINLGPVALAPANDEAFAAALAAWELDKGLYEIRYELGNRPDWLGVPILGLLADGDQIG